MKKQKQVHIIGLTLNKPLGIIHAHKLVFDKDNKLIKFMGEVGSGKTTEQEIIQIGLHGTKAMSDNLKYGEIDLELQLVDGDLPFFVSRKTKGKKIVSTLYIKDKNGKIEENPIIDGVTATPSKYFDSLETKLSWHMSELTSDNPNIQKKILLQLYQSQLSTIGVIFDKKHPDYSNTILGKIDKAVKNRDEKDYERKKVGGIADDLKAKGHDPDRPESCPDSVNISAIDIEIKALEKEITQKEAAPEMVKQNALTEIKAKAGEITNKCLAYNSELQADLILEKQKYDEYINESRTQDENVGQLEFLMEKLGVKNEFSRIFGLIEIVKEIEEPTTPNYILFEKNQVIYSPDLNDEGLKLISELDLLRMEYSTVYSENPNIDTTSLTEKIAIQEQNKKDGIEINKIVDAIDSFHQWRKSNEDVVKLKSEYVKLLAKVDTGVDGLEIIPNEDDIFLMYNGAYDSEYFNNPNLEMRKLSSYSGTQKPVICLLIQDYLLSKKPKAMRYMFIDDIPHDNKTRELLEDMTEKLDLNIFLNWTGDFEQDKLNKGEILIKGGEVFFYGV